MTITTEPGSAETTRSAERSMVNGVGNGDGYDRRLRELSEEMEGIRGELERTWEVLHADMEGASNSTVDCEVIIAALKALRQSEAAKIIELTNETHRIADKMSYAIRMRATERERVMGLRQLVETLDILQGDYCRLRTAIGDSNANLASITTLYHDVRRQANPRLVSAWRARYGANFEELLEQEQQHLAGRLLGALHAHILAMDGKGGLEEAMAGVFTHLRLFYRIDALTRAIPDACEAIRTFATKTLLNIIDTQAMLDFRWASKAAKVVDFGRGLGSWCDHQCRELARGEQDLDNGGDGAALAASSFSPEPNDVMPISSMRASLLEGSMGVALEILLQVLKSFLEEKRIAALRREPETDARELDMVTAELALLVQSALSLLRNQQTIRSPSQDTLFGTSSLLELLASMLQSYSELESNYMRRGVRLAIQMSEVSVGGGCSTSVEDLFFILKKAINRALALGDQPTILVVLEQARANITGDFISFVQRRSRQLYPDPRTGDSVKVCLNDVTMAKMYLLALADEIKGLVDVRDGRGDGNETSALPLFTLKPMSDKVLPLDSFARSKIIISANDLEMLAVTHLDGMARALADTIYATQIKSKLAPFLVQLFKDPLVSAIPEHESANDRVVPEGALSLSTTLPSFVHHVDSVIWPVLEELVGDAKILLVLMVTREFAGALERKLLHNSVGSRWTAFSVAILEHDFRQVSSYLADLSELQSREHLLRLNQLLMVLGAETKVEAASMAKGLLEETQLKGLLSLRSDW